MRTIKSVAGVALAVTLLVGCTGGDPEPGPTGSATSPTATDAATPDASVTVSAAFGDAPVTARVHPLEVDGGTAVLTVDFTMDADAPDDAAVSMGLVMNNAETGTHLGGVRLVDLEAGTVWWPARDGSKVLSSRDGTTVVPGETTTAQVVFAAPGDADVVDVMLPQLGLATDVPVVSGGAAAAEELGVGSSTEYPSAPLEVFTAAYDEGSQVAAEGDQTTYTLASDVLFATDEFALTDAAAAVVDAAAQQIAEAGAGGEVAVVGHTDDRASDEYNLDLSRKRAQSVADRLAGTLGADYTLRTEGMGESQPTAPGSSEEARAANRRVEIRFTAADVAAAISGAGGSAQAPDPTGAVGSGTATVRATSVDGYEYDVRAVLVERRAGYLVGTLEVVPQEDRPITTLLGPVPPGPSQARGFSEVLLQSSAFGVSLLGESSRFYPVDYVTRAGEEGEPAQRTVLADRVLTEVAAGEPTTVTVVWPDTGEDDVDIDVDGVFRIADVPVED